MIWKRKVVIPVTVGIALAIVSVYLGIERFRTRQVSLVVGAVLQQAADPKRQAPLKNARITVAGANVDGECDTDDSGLFRLRLHPSVPVGSNLVLQVEHPNYQPLTIAASAGDRIYVVRMVPLANEHAVQSNAPPVQISDVRVRYAETLTTTVDVGAIVRTFEVVNKGNIPCQKGSACSPDGKWKASIGGVSFDAGEGNGIKSVRVSCIAGPCPFTKIENGKFPEGSRKIHVSVRDWSDTVTYLVEAQVFRTLSTDTIRDFYPVIFGRSMNFTLPPASEGPSIEADVNGEAIVFPLGPDLKLSWANCSVQTAADHAKLYRCELKPGYQLR
jgi:hypothetical protein